jgi:hypothetical protein
MATWRDQVALVTGGARGIGRATSLLRVDRTRPRRPSMPTGASAAVIWNRCGATAAQFDTNAGTSPRCCSGKAASAVA